MTSKLCSGKPYQWFQGLLRSVEHRKRQKTNLIAEWLRGHRYLLLANDRLQIMEKRTLSPCADS